MTVEQIDDEHKLLISQLLRDEGIGDQALKSYVKERLPDDFGSKDVELFVSFLSLMLRTDPKARKTTSQLLGHPFLVGHGEDDTEKPHGL